MCSFLLVLNRKIIIKKNIQNTVASSYYSKVSLTKKYGAPFFLVWVHEFSIISLCLGTVEAFPIVLTTGRSTVNICIKTKGILFLIVKC